jgi:hypothetical protein
MSFAAKGNGALLRVLEDARHELRCGRNKLTVLSTQVDPYRLDTPAGHRDGAWLAEQLDRAVGAERRIHWRGLHYAIVAAGDIRKPNGEIYRNDDANWTWLANSAGKAARWLGYVDFERIIDNRNSDPVILRRARVTPEAWVSIGLDITIPDVDELEPYAGVASFEGRQPYALTIFGEKTSLEDVLLPLARRFEADCFYRPVRSLTRCSTAWPGTALKTGAPWWCLCSPTATRPATRWRCPSVGSCRRSAISASPI